MGKRWINLEKVVSISSFLIPRLAQKCLFSQKCRFSTRTIVLCSCRQLSSCFISAPRSASWNILSQFKFTPCNPALRATVRSNIRPIFAYREKYICKKVSHEFISRSAKKIAKKKWKRDERKKRKIVLKRRNFLKIILSRNE